MSDTIWLIDRSRVSDGREFCERSRLLNYHVGPNGYGITLKGTKLPLMTGIAGHDGLAPILEWARDHAAEIQQALRLPEAQTTTDAILIVPAPVVRQAVKAAQDRYWKVVAARGFAYLDENLETKQVTQEQCFLIEGLIWAWTLEVLPEVLRRGRILEVEHDDTYVFGCTCQLGDGIGTKNDHEARECQGIGLQCKPDFLLLTYHTEELEYHEFKTTSLDGSLFRDKWEVQIQTFSAILDAERRHGKQVQSVYIHGLVKGRREGEYNADTGKRDGAYKQQSVFCYGYRKAANPPMEQEQWAATYEYFDAYEGKTKRLGKAWKKVPLWELPQELVPAGMSKGEYWARWIPADARRKGLVVLGPFQRQGQMVQHFLEETQGEEARWQQGLWQLYDLGQAIIAERYPEGVPTEHAPAIWWEVVWPDPRFQTQMNYLFPRSYACRRYGMRNRCQFESICLGHEGWANPVASGRYIDRRPHHKDELEQALRRGLLLPEDGLADDVEQEI